MVLYPREIFILQRIENCQPKMNSTRTKILIVFLAFLGTFTTALADDIQSIGVPYVQNYPKSSYLSGNQNWSIAKDKNGKDIYECDEMSGEDAYGEKIKGVVKFIDGAFVLISSNHFFTQVGHSNHSHTYFRDMASQLEICGLVIANLLVTEE